MSIGALLWGNALGPKQGNSITNVGYLATFAAMGALTVAVLLMVVAFFTPNYTFYYVAQNHSTDVSPLAWLYKLSGLWAGREGSFLFWAWLLSLFASWVAYKRLEFTDALSNMGLMVTNIVLTLFTAGMMFSEPNNPFKVTPASLVDPATGKLLGEATAWGMNPLLQHWAMIIHPPTLFIGYAGLTIPFAFAIAALIVNDGSKKWVEIVDRITVFSWLFLGIGIGLGSIWAYVVLGWGGYWAWDPVENASLLPWLTGVGLLHSFTVYRRRDGFKRWAIMLAAFSFALVILGTFITRSGIVQSVHAFEADPVSLWLFLGMIVGSLAAAGIGLLMRWKTFDGNDEFESLTSKEAAYYFNNVIMLVAGVLVAYLTITSALPAWLPFGGKSIPATTFDSVARPVGILYLLILAVCPILSWRGTDGPTFWKRIKWPLVGAAVLFGLLLIDFVSTLRPIYNTMVALRCDRERGGAQDRKCRAVLVLQRTRHLRPLRGRAADRHANLALHRWRAQACGGQGRELLLGARRHLHERPHPVGRLPDPHRHGHHLDRSCGLGDVRARSDLQRPGEGRVDASRSISTPSPIRAASRRRWRTATTRRT